MSSATELEFDFDPRKKFRATDAKSARQAAFENIPLKNTQRWTLLKIHGEHPDGLTNDELSQLTPIILVSLTTRCTELVQGGFLEETGETRKTRNGISAEVKRITEKGKQALSDQVSQINPTTKTGEKLCQEKNSTVGCMSSAKSGDRACP
jgi:hypothetical protein